MQTENNKRIPRGEYPRPQFVRDCWMSLNGEWEFKALTIEDVRRGVVWIENGDIIAKTIQTTDDLQEWYRKTFGQDAGLNYPDVLDE